jgi:hypothetical protein
MKKKIIFENKETNYSADEFGNIYNDKFNRIMKGTTARNEYRSVQLSIEGKVKTFMVHRLVAEAFLPNPNNYPIVDHIDRNKMNNKLSNLRLVSQAENMNNAQINGHRGQVKISRYDKEGNFIAKYNSIREAARQIDCSDSTIKRAADAKKLEKVIIGFLIHRIF